MCPWPPSRKFIFYLTASDDASRSYLKFLLREEAAAETVSGNMKKKG